MATDVLVSERVELGLELLEELRKSGFPITAAFWAKRSDDGLWFMYIASPIVDKDGPSIAYQNLFAIMATVPNVRSLQFDIKLIGAIHPAAMDVQRFQSQASLPGLHQFRQLGNMAIEEAYIYAL